MSRIPCRVCNKPYDGTTHCLVMACKSCAMFFKRSEVREYIKSCKYGNNSCKLDKAGKITCSACRYTKCIEAGMKTLQNRRSMKCIENKQVDDNSLVGDMKMTIERPELVVEAMSTLKRFCHFYAQTANTKKANEFAMLHADGTKLIELPGNRYGARLTQSLSNRLMNHDICEFYKLMNGAFPAFTAMENTSQDNLIHLLTFPLFELSTSFRSLRVFNNVNCRKMLCTEVLFADLDHLDGILDPNKFDNPMDCKAIEDYMKDWWYKFVNSTLRTMHRLEITDMEFIAVCALTIWDEANVHHNPELSTMAEKHRNMIYKDLDYYYRNILQMNNYVERVMNLKELISITKGNYEIISDSICFLRTFQYYTSNEGLWDSASKVIDAFESIKI